MSNVLRSLYSFILLAVLIFATKTAVALPDGFEMTVLTDEVPTARQLAESDSGILYVGSRGAGVVYAVVQDKETGQAIVNVLARDLPEPSGITLFDGDLYIAALNQIIRISDVDQNLQAPELEVLTDSLPSDRWHGWKYLIADDDGNLYFNVGAPCNTCLREDERYASILKFDTQNSESTVFAHGVRNSVGFAWHPDTGLLWFSDNGRDMMGPEVPFEEINVVTEPGQHFGFPYVHAGITMDPEYGKDKNADDYERPVWSIRAHAAALGITFYTANQFPEKFENALFIAEHGSWNHAPGQPRGYQVSVLVNSDEGLAYEVFTNNFSRTEEDESEGRPNDVLVSRDGSLLISDDSKGTVFRVTYTGN